MMRRLSLAIALVLVLPACGSDSNNATGGSGGTAGAGGMAGTPDAADKGGTGGGVDAPVCPDGMACQLGGANGICMGGACGACTDVTGDAACVTAYGSGNLCIGGSCITAQCHDSSGCSGRLCVDNQCVGCTSDAECDAGQICNASGSCVDAAAACSGGSVGSACGTGDRCCTVSGTLTCLAVACCTNAQCNTNETCQGGTCVSNTSGCTAPATATYYVDPTYAGVSTGTTTCPFKTLHGAFNAVRTDAFTGDSDVIIKGGTIDATSEGGAQFFPITVPSSVYVRTIGSATTDATIVAPMNTSAFQAPYVAQSTATANYAARISHLTIKQAAAGATAGTAVHVTGGTVAKPVHLDHLTIRNFFNGVNVDGGGKAALDFGVDVQNCTQTGLYVSAGRVDMTVGANTDARSHFDNNGLGIYVSDDANSVLNIQGAEDATGLKTITASSNTGAGIRLTSPNTNNAISNVGILNNGGNGILLFGGSNVKIRHVRLDGSGASNINIINNGSITSLAGIDLGTLADMGHNEFRAATDSHVCVATTFDASSFHAAGNIFGQVDCSSTAGGNVRMFLTCAGHGGGFNDGAPQFRENVDYCSFAVQP